MAQIKTKPKQKKKLSRHATLEKLGHTLLPTLFSSLLEIIAKKELGASWEKAILSRARQHYSEDEFNVKSSITPLALYFFFQGLLQTEYKQMVKILSANEDYTLTYDDYVKLLRKYRIYINSWMIYAESSISHSKAAFAKIVEFKDSSLSLTDSEKEVIREVIESTNDIDPKVMAEFQENLMSKYKDIYQNIPMLHCWYRSLPARFISGIGEIGLESSPLDVTTYQITTDILNISLRPFKNSKTTELIKWFQTGIELCRIVYLNNDLDSSEVDLYFMLFAKEISDGIENKRIESTPKLADFIETIKPRL